MTEEKMKASYHYKHTKHKGQKRTLTLANRYLKKRKMKPLNVNKSDWSIKKEF